MSDVRKPHSRREALKCLACGGAGTLFALSGGVFTPIDLARAAIDKKGTARLGKPLFVQISDTHSGFNKEANPDVSGTLNRAIDLVNAMHDQPPLIIHTGDITHLSRLPKMLGVTSISEKKHPRSLSFGDATLG
jgi:hypothetical protein